MVCECGVVTAAVLCMEHQAQVEQFRFLVGETAVVADGMQHRFRSPQSAVVGMEEHALMIILMALYLISIRHNHRQPRDQFDRLA